MTATDDTLPTMRCPRCRAEHPDYDGFGFVAHTKPAYADGCGWCSHPSRDGDGKGGMVCGICGDVEPGAIKPLLEGEVTRDPEWEANWNEAHALGRADALAERDPQVLTGRLGAHDDAYSDGYAEALVEIAAAKESN